jgi:hypothetical protein
VVVVGAGGAAGPSSLSPEPWEGARGRERTACCVQAHCVLCAGALRAVPGACPSLLPGQHVARARARWVRARSPRTLDAPLLAVAIGMRAWRGNRGGAIASSEWRRARCRRGAARWVRGRWWRWSAVLLTRTHADQPPRACVLVGFETRAPGRTPLRRAASQRAPLDAAVAVPPASPPRPHQLGLADLPASCPPLLGRWAGHAAACQDHPLITRCSCVPRCPSPHRQPCGPAERANEAPLKTAREPGRPPLAPRGHDAAQAEPEVLRQEGLQQQG